VSTDALLYFEDMTPSRVFEGGRAVMDAAAVKDFARQFDPQPFHLDEDAAKESFFGGLVASGWHTAAATMRMMVETMPVGGGSIGAGIDELRWPRAVQAGDVLSVRMEVLEARPMRSKPGQGLVKTRVQTLQQDGDVVQSMVCTTVVPMRDGGF
jgi:acyl dehydratase